MVDEVKNNLDKIVDTCKQMQVKSLYLFGSGSRKSDYTKNSDLDFLVQFDNDGKWMPRSGFDYFDLLDKLEEMTGIKVDLVAEERIRNNYLLRSIMEDKICLYET